MGNENKTLLDSILEFIDQFGCDISIKHADSKHVHVEINGCTDHVGRSNKLIQEKLCPGLTFEPVIAKLNQFVFECVERDMTLIIRYKDDKAKEKPNHGPYRFDSPFGMPHSNRK